MNESEQIKYIPKNYFIELTNFCNLKCIMCNFHSELVRPSKPRTRGYMNTDLAKRIIREIAGFDTLSWVAFHGAGESLLHKELIEILRYCRQFSTIRPGLLTNGALLSRDMSIKIIESGIAWIGFSLDGIDKDKFEKYRVGADYDRIIKNVLDFINLKEETNSSISIKVNMTLQEDMKDDVEDFIRFWIDRVDEVSISPCKPIGSRKSNLIPENTERIPCYMLYEVMVIFWDGSVALCCEDWFNHGEMGSLTKESISEIWNSKKMNSIRKQHETGIFDELPLCRDCDSWYNPLSIEYFDPVLNCKVLKNAWQYVYQRNFVNSEKGYRHKEI